MPETEVALLKRPTAVTLVDASRQGTTPSFIDGRPAEQQAHILERVQNLPLSPMWREVIERADPAATTWLATDIFKAAENRNERGLLKDTARQLAIHFPTQLLQAEIDVNLEPARERYAGPHLLSDLLARARRDYAYATHKNPRTTKAISDSWIVFAGELAIRYPQRHAHIFTEAKKAYETQYAAAGAIAGLEPGYDNLIPEEEALKSLAHVLTRNFPRIVVSHLRAPQPARVEAAV